ncbi:MAG: endonuclease III [Prevotella sp.]|nr:endonuclease III [Prevotella sp.]
MNKKERTQAVLAYFQETMGKTTTELEFGSVFQLLVATVLSAQCTDKRINQVTPELFRHYPDAQSMSKAEVDDILQLIKSVSYPNSKALHLSQMSKMLVSDFNGEVPSEMKELTKLPGVGRKTANVVQAVGFGMSAIAVDTHVFRVSHRLGLVSSRAKTPEKVEAELKKAIPKDLWADAHHWLLLHGRYVCKSRMPDCGKCPFTEYCPKESLLK